MNVDNPIMDPLRGSLIVIIVTPTTTTMVMVMVMMIITTAIPRRWKSLNVMRSRLIILINEKINEANWMVSNSAKLDRRTKQHTQFGVSASNGSRDMARTKSWRKKGEKKKLTKRIRW